MSTCGNGVCRPPVIARYTNRARDFLEYITERGIDLKVTDSVEGFIPLNQLGQDVDHPSEIHKVGEKIFAEVVEFDLEGRKIILSISDYFKDKDENVFKQYLEAHVPQKIVKEEKQEKLEPVATEPENG